MNRKLILLSFFLILFLHISADLNSIKSVIKSETKKAVKCLGTCMQKLGIQCGDLCCLSINCIGQSCSAKTAIDIGGCNMTIPNDKT